MKRHQSARFALLLLAVVVSGVPTLLLARPWLPPAGPEGFRALVTSTCALALVGCWAWLAVGTLVVAAQSLLAPGTGSPAPAGRGVRWVPATLRVLVPVLVGATVTGGPASAGTQPGASEHQAPSSAGAGAVRLAGRLAGLPLPDRVPSVAPPERTVLVRPGDSLWRITARLLADPAPAAVVDRGWRRLARANSARVPDPHLIQPGTRLRVPPLAAHPREEAP